MIKHIRQLCRGGAMLVLLGAFHSAAIADGFYIGAGTYQAEVSINNFDDDDSVPAFFVGYTFIDSVVILSAELGKYDLGEYNDGSTDIETDAISLAAVATLALGPFIEVYAKAGIASVDVDVNGEDFDDEESFRGVGIGFDLLDTLDLYAEYLSFDTEVDSEMIGVGLRLDF